jgi:hypothetical protein
MHGDMSGSGVKAATNSMGKVRRGGLTVLEFVGCVIAVVGGAWLGALYLGVDVRHVAHTVLSESELLDKVPPQWRPTDPKDNPMTRDQLVTMLREEFGALRQDLTTLQTGASGQTAESPGPRTTSSGNPSLQQATKDKTRAYWLRINDIALGEAALQQDAESAANGANSARVFAIKARISRFAAKSVEAVPNDGVDESVVQFGRQLAQWYEHGGELYERAVQIWESPTASQGREQLNRDWRRSELHHRNEALLLKDKAVGVRSAISRQFGEEFPEFAKPTTTTNSTGATLPALPEEMDTTEEPV